MVLFAAQFTENIGRAISGLAIEFLIYELTKSPLLIGVLAIVWLLPFVIVAPLAGALADPMILTYLTANGFVWVVVVGNIVLRFKTTSDLADK